MASRVDPSPKIPELTGVRGVAACWVLLFHIWLVAGSPTVEVWQIDLTPLFSCGWAGVDLFFVLSGFALTWPHANMQSQQVDYVDFMRRRVLRVVPAYYAQFLFLLLLAASGAISEIPTLGNALAHLFFLHNFNFEWSRPLPNTWWTLPIEWQFYLLFPLLLPVFQRAGIARVILAAVLVVLTWRVGTISWIQHYSPTAPIDYRVWLIEQLPGRIDQFVVGMVAALIARRVWPRLDVQSRNRLSTGLVLSGLISIAALVAFLWPRAQAYWQGHWLLLVWHLLIAPPLAALITGAAMGGGLSRILFATRPILGLGEISYSIYLWNYAVLLGLVRLGAFDDLEGTDRLAWVTMFSVLPVVLVATVSWWLTERPFLHYRDSNPESTAGRHVARFIKSPWRTVAFAGLSIMAILVVLHWYLRPERASLGECTERGAVDQPSLIDASIKPIEIVGWTHDWDRTDRVRRIVVVLNNRIIGEATPSLERPDVSAALDSCRVSRPGFRLTLPPMDLPVLQASLSVEAERSSGRRYRIGAIDWRFGAPRVSIDSAEPPSPAGDNRIIGWAWHPSGPVTVRWLRGDRVLASGLADGSREDVAKAFPLWPRASQSGFGLTVRFAELPRGVEDSVIEFVAPDGQSVTLKGPRIENDRPIGTVISIDNRRFVNPHRVPVSAWVYDEHGVISATVATELGVQLGTLKKGGESEPLPGLFSDPRGIPEGPFWNDILRRGILFMGSVSANAIPQGIQRLVVHARDSQSRDVELPGPLVSVGMPPLPVSCHGEPFTVYLWATTEMLRKGLPDLTELRRMAEGGCARFGIHTRVEYLRTTRGKESDYIFDPDFPDRLRFQKSKEMTTTSLREALAMADRHAVPMRILLDGGVWADAHFSFPEYDITDWLEQGDRNVQWNQFGKAEKDDALRGLAGSHDNPELARVMNLSIYNQQYRHYKKRNLQAAIKLIADYNRRHPTRPVSVTFDPDLYINPWFYLKQWYDYNPDTLRQFREWLTHTGPYSPDGKLAGTGYRKRLDLEAINRIAKAAWQKIDEVDPPRERPNYDDSWHQIWTIFKRHLVGRHYADLAQWSVEAGLAPSLIFTAQTFIQADVSVTGDDRATGWTDEAGVSMAGAKPPNGHMGVILYGPASRNHGKPRSGTSLFANIRDVDSRWEVAEMNPADIESPKRLPTHTEAYQTLTAIFNYGAGGMSPMWTGVAGDLSVRPGQFRSYDTLVQSPFETQLVLLLREVARFPRGSQLWTFGNAYVASDDGFTATAGSRIRALPGSIEISREAAGVDPSPVGMVRQLEGWQVPADSCLRVHAGGKTFGSVHLRSLGGAVLDETWQSSDGGTEIRLTPMVGQRLADIRLLFRIAPVVLSEVTLGPCQR